jgi:hypothetical protein
MTLRALSALCIVIGLASASTPSRPARAGGPPADLVTRAARFFEAYGDALRAGRSEALAQFYEPSGTLRVIDGRRRRLTRSALDSVYRGGWQGPAFFAWENLEFDSLDAKHVFVTGFFRWQSRGAPDTSRYIYAAMLQAADTSLVLRFEHETAVGRP